jgi:hypothetical protein
VARGLVRRRMGEGCLLGRKRVGVACGGARRLGAGAPAERAVGSLGWTERTMVQGAQARAVAAKHILQQFRGVGYTERCGIARCAEVAQW